MNARSARLDSVVQHFSAVTYAGHDPVPARRAVPHLRSYYSRHHFISPHTTAGGTNWDVADHWVEETLRQGQVPIALMVGLSNERAGSFAAQCAKTASRYAGKVGIWEIGNEVDTEGAWLFDGYRGEQAGQVYRMTRAAILAVQPDAIVIAPSIQSVWPTGHGLQTLAGVLRGYGPELPPDIALHLYPERDGVEDVARAVERVRGCLAAHAKGSPRLWVTEWGCTFWPQLEAAERGAFQRDMLRQLKSAAVHAACWYAFDHDSIGYAHDVTQGRRQWNDSARRVLGSEKDAQR